ncbi:hypothetical protein PIB30_091814 [Stylosanthes scabra]|uniref:GRF-type domain-containing protein n=1 Tax=Stylosanthes scabra TaxID=79078 RepID=A0ABU6WT12_9FABA|nr:hypothetical protein [Stylosanthes scabra]
MASQNSWSSRRGGSSVQSRRTVVCHHGAPAVLRTSGTKENPGRRFWGCVFYEEQCDFFCWADLEQAEEDPEKAKLRRKVISLKLKVKAIEMRLQIAAIVGLVGWVWLISIWIDKLGATTKHGVMPLK